MSPSDLHVVFDSASAPPLRHALRQARQPGRVLVFRDDLSFGPIKPPDRTRRAAWVERKFGLPLSFPEHPAAIPARAMERFWKSALTGSGRRVVWLSRRRPSQYAGLLEWNWRLGARPYEVMDFTRIEVDRRQWNGRPWRGTIEHLVQLTAEEILRNGLIEQAAAPSAAARARWIETWRRLRTENAAFRLVKGERLVSAPIDHFDRLLLAEARLQYWYKAARVVGIAMGKPAAGGMCTTVLTACLHKLAESGRLEAAGDLWRTHYSEVRLPRR